MFYNIYVRVCDASPSHPDFKKGIPVPAPIPASAPTKVGHLTYGKACLVNRAIEFFDPVKTFICTQKTQVYKHF